MSTRIITAYQQCYGALALIRAELCGLRRRPASSLPSAVFAQLISAVVGITSAWLKAPAELMSGGTRVKTQSLAPPGAVAPTAGERGGEPGARHMPSLVKIFLILCG